MEWLFINLEDFDLNQNAQWHRLAAKLPDDKEKIILFFPEGRYAIAQKEGETEDYLIFYIYRVYVDKAKDNITVLDKQYILKDFVLNKQDILNNCIDTFLMSITPTDHLWTSIPQNYL